MDDGTPRALQPLAEEVLALVARARQGDDIEVSDDDLRRIELCAQATINLDRLVSTMSPSGHICHGDAEGACPHDS